MTQADYSALFPLEDGLCYLNHAAVSPWPSTTRDAVAKFANENIHTGAQHYLSWLQTEAELRERLRQLINASSTEEIALAKNTSEALSIIAYGIDWKAGDEVIISDQEFPSNRIVWESLAQHGVKLVVVPIEPDTLVQDIDAAMTNNTRLVSISSVQYASGYRVDLPSLSKVCQKHEVMLCVDAIQSLGAVTFDQQEIQADFIVADGHKWMMAAEGLALFYIKQAHIPELKLHQYGWHMIAESGNYDKKEWELAPDAKRFECGSPNMLGAYALNASLKTLLDIGIEQVSEAIQSNVDYLIDALEQDPRISIVSSKDRSKRGGIVTFNAEGVDHAKLYKTLMGKRVICAHRGGGVRLSPGFYTPKAVLDEALSRIFETLDS